MAAWRQKDSTLDPPSNRLRNKLKNMSATPNADAEGVVSKVQVKKEIKTIVENLETILGDLKDVAKELKEVNERETRHKAVLLSTGRPCAMLCF